MIFVIVVVILSFAYISTFGICGIRCVMIVDSNANISIAVIANISTVVIIN